MTADEEQRPTPAAQTRSTWEDLKAREASWRQEYDSYQAAHKADREAEQAVIDYAHDVCNRYVSGELSREEARRFIQKAELEHMQHGLVRQPDRLAREDDPYQDERAWTCRLCHKRNLNWDMACRLCGMNRLPPPGPPNTWLRSGAPRRKPQKPSRPNPFGNPALQDLVEGGEHMQRRWWWPFGNR